MAYEQPLGRRAIRTFHRHLVFSRRVQVLADTVARFIPRGRRVLDVGAGSGEIAAVILTQRPDLSIEGCDVYVRPETHIPVRHFDGRSLPFQDESFDYAILVDVLHHADDPSELLSEASRVAPAIVIKDHYRNGLLAGLRLRFMDWVGNAPHGVRLPYNYLSRVEWEQLWSRLGLRVRNITEQIPLYPFPLSWLFGTRLHFVAELRRMNLD
jgi:SAM-dependent methyltransferase